MTTAATTSTEVTRPLIVVGVDGSAHSIKAIEWAVAHARLTGGTVQLVTAWAQIVSYGMPVVLAGIDEEADAHDLIAKAAAGVDLPAERLQTQVVHGAPSPVLVERSTGADLLVVGARGHGGFSELVLGSVSDYVVHHAHCTVVVVR